MIVVDRVTKYYGSQPAVRDLTFRIEEGECVGFLGLNGAGKTTTLRILSCLSLPTSGRVTIRKLDVETEPHQIRKFIGFLPDRPPLYPEMTVGEYVRFAGLLRQMTKAELEKRLPKVLDTCGLSKVADQGISTLSHGYQQRVGIAQAIIHKPALLILDEPIQGLDPVQIVEMREMIRGLHGEHTILLSTHILSEIQKTCDRILMLHEGRITAQGKEEDLALRFAEALVVELEVRVPSDKLATYREGIPGEGALRAAIANISSADGAKIEPLGKEGDDILLKIAVRGKNDVREQLSRSIVEAGLGLLAMTRRTAGLENIFVELSKGGLAPKSGESAAPPSSVARRAPTSDEGLLDENEEDSVEDTHDDAEDEEPPKASQGEDEEPS